MSNQRRTAGSVVKRGRKWAVVVDLGVDPTDGKRRRRWHSGYSTRREAEKALAEILTNLRRGVYVEPAKLTVATFLTDEWLPAIRDRIRPSTLLSYEMHVRLYLIPHIGDRMLQRLEPPHLNAMYALLLESGGRGDRSLSKRTVRLTHTTIRKALKDAQRWGRVVRNVADLADPPAPPRPVMRAWTGEQVSRFLAFASEHDPDSYPLWRLAATTGSRRGELCGTTWSDLDLDEGAWRITKTRIVVGSANVIESEPKTAAGRRIVALDATTVTALRTQRRIQLEQRMALGTWPDNDLVFTDAVGQPVHPDRVTDRFRRLVRAAGLPPISLHGLRHSAASLLMSAGENPELVRQRLGHASVKTTLSLYVHAMPADMQRSADRLAAMIDQT